MEIPYTITARPDTGLSNGKLGIWLFLASEVMLFGALFTAYLFVRLGAEDGTWPSHVQSIPLGLTNTVLLIISSITMVWAWVALKERKFNTYRLALALTMLCGVLFLCIKGREYYDKYLHWGFLIKEDSFAKYEPTLKKMDVFYSPIPSQHAFEVRGHLHSSNDTSFTFLPDKNFHPWGETPTPGGTDSTENTVNAPKSGKDAEEETLTLPKSDLERWGQFPSRLRHLLRDVFHRHRSPRDAHHRRPGGDGLLYRTGRQDVSPQPRTALQPDRGHGHLLAFRRSRLDHRFPHLVSHLIATKFHP